MPECLCKHPERSLTWPHDCARCRGIIIGRAGIWEDVKRAAYDAKIREMEKAAQLNADAAMHGFFAVTVDGTRVDPATTSRTPPRISDRTED